MVMLDRAGYPADSFYNVYDFRIDGAHFTQQPPYHDNFLANSLIQVDSAGSVLVMRAELARKVKFMEHDVIVDPSSRGNLGVLAHAELDVGGTLRGCRLHPPPSSGPPPRAWRCATCIAGSAPRIGHTPSVMIAGPSRSSAAAGLAIAHTTPGFASYHPAGS